MLRPLEGLGLSELPDKELPDQCDRSAWPSTRKSFEEVFGGRPRDEWVEQFAHLDACVTPVLALDEVAEHPHIAARDTIVEAFGQRQPAVAPRFATSPPPDYSAPRTPGSDNAAVFREWCVAGDEHEQ